MLLRTIYDEGLAQASYLIGCQRTGDALVIDPARDVDRYFDLADAHELRLVAAVETHIHADFLSGVREMCARDTGIAAVLPAAGGDEWMYTWAGEDGVAVRYMQDGDEFQLGGVLLKALHTPGHTPEHMSYLVHDQGSGAPVPIGIATGDFVFVGDLGRPDLLETAAGQSGTMAASAERLAASSVVFNGLPEHLQVWPGHGSGSACGKALGAVPASTVGYEKRTNAALQLASQTDRFVASILAGQPEPPAYFGRMKVQNRDGAPILGSLPRPKTVEPSEIDEDVVILDTRPWEEFRAGHLAKSISAPRDWTLSTVAGSFVSPEQRVALVADEASVSEAVRALVRVGIDRIVLRIDPSALAQSTTESCPEVSAKEAQSVLARGDAVALDVRRRSEHVEGHIPGSVNVSHVQLVPRIDEVPKGKRLMVCCRSGVRSARATSLLRALGYDATSVAGGFEAWEACGFAVAYPSDASAHKATT